MENNLDNSEKDNKLNKEKNKNKVIVTVLGSLITSSLVVSLFSIYIKAPDKKSDELNADLEESNENMHAGWESFSLENKTQNSVKKLKGASRPINNELDRAEVLSAFEFVDYVVIFEEDTPINLLEIIKPDVYTKGADYTLETLPEAKTVLKNNGRVEFINFVEGKSTTNIINKIENK